MALVCSSNVFSKKSLGRKGGEIAEGEERAESRDEKSRGRGERVESREQRVRGEQRTRRRKGEEGVK